MPTIVDVEQGSDAWFRARMGMPTTSMFATVMAKSKSGGESITRRKYMFRLAGEIITGGPFETYSNAHMERGREMEGEARSAYAFLKDADPRKVGFAYNDLAGASPDSIVGDDGALEIKTKLPDLLVDLIISSIEAGAPILPPEHKAQTQGHLWVLEREWIDLAVYFRKMPLYVVRSYRDEAYIASIVRAVREFNDELAIVVEKLRRYEEAA